MPMPPPPCILDGQCFARRVHSTVPERRSWLDRLGSSTANRCPMMQGRTRASTALRVPRTLWTLQALLVWWGLRWHPHVRILCIRIAMWHSTAGHPEVWQAHRPSGR